MDSDDFGCLIVAIAIVGLIVMPAIAPWWATLAWLGFILAVLLIMYVVRAVTHRSRD